MWKSREQTFLAEKGCSLQFCTATATAAAAAAVAAAAAAAAPDAAAAAAAADKTFRRKIGGTHQIWLSL